MSSFYGHVPRACSYHFILVPVAVSFFSVTDTRLLFAVETGKVFQLSTEGTSVVSCAELRGHIKDVYAILSLGARILPRHWLPSIIGRDNVVNYYKCVASLCVSHTSNAFRVAHAAVL